MPDIKHFAPVSALIASENLAEFIRLCRDDLTVFGTDIDWDATCWERAANFTKLGAHARGYSESDRMDEAFIDFAKSYFRYQQGHHPTGAKNEAKALRASEAALVQAYGNADVSMLISLLFPTCLSSTFLHRSVSPAF